MTFYWILVPTKKKHVDKVFKKLVESNAKLSNILG